MKVVILAGGLGTRLTEETSVKPKPAVEIGPHPIIWHIMKHYAHYGFREFLVALGYRGEVLKRYFLDYHTVNNGAVTVHLGNGNVDVQGKGHEDWVVHLIDTGLQTMTGGRVRRLRPWLKDAAFMLTYGDAVSDINITALLELHRAHGRVTTVTGVRPPARFGGLVFDGDLVTEFTEKPQVGEGWINGGYMVIEPTVFEYLDGDDTSLEHDVLEKLASENQLVAYRHESFWQCMDTMRDKRLLESLWQEGRAPWKVWEQ